MGNTKIKDLEHRIEDYNDICREIDILRGGLLKNPFCKDEHLAAIARAQGELRQKIRTLRQELRDLQRQSPADPAPAPQPNNEVEQPDKPAPQPEQPDTPPVPQPPAPPSNQGLRASVGAGGKNLREDVLRVQELLIARTRAAIKADGQCGAKTIGAIRNLQQRLFQTWTVDGRVDPGGATWRWLIGSGALPELPPRPVTPPNPPKPPAPNPIIPPKPGEQSTIKQVIHNALQFFIDNYAQYNNTIFKVKINGPKIPVYGPLYLTASFDADAKASIKSTKSGNKISSTAAFNAQATLKVGLGVGFSFGYEWSMVSATAEAVLEGGAFGQAQFSVQTTLSLEGNRQQVTGSIQPLQTALRMNLGLYAKCSAKVGAKLWGWGMGISLDWLTNRAATYVAQFGKGQAKGSEVRWTLHTINILQIQSPTYSLSFDFGQKRFLAQASGAYRFEVHPDLKAVLQNLLPMRILR